MHIILDRIRSLVRANKATPQSVLIAMLNPQIKGWANYHHCAVAAESIRPSPLRNLELSVAMGAAASSTQGQEMVVQAILDYLAQAVGVRDAGAGCQWQAPMGQTD